jgi:hypothetical protein
MRPYVVCLRARPDAARELRPSVYIGSAWVGKFDQSDFAMPSEMEREKDGGLGAYEALMRRRLEKGGRSLARGSPFMDAEWWRWRLLGFNTPGTALLCACGRGKACHGWVLVKLAEELALEAKGAGGVGPTLGAAPKVGGNEGLFGEVKDTRYV